MSERQFVLTLSCEDRPGIVAAVTTEFADLGANIAESGQFWDQVSPFLHADRSFGARKRRQGGIAKGA